MIYFKCRLFDPQRSFILYDCIIVLALTVIRETEVIDRVGHIDIIHFEYRLIDPQRSFILYDRIIVLALTIIRETEVV